MGQESASTDLLLRLASLVHIPDEMRGRLRRQIARTSKKESPKSFEVIRVLILFLQFGLEPVREDTKKAIEACVQIILSNLDAPSPNQEQAAQETLHQVELTFKEFVAGMVRRYRIDLEHLRKKEKVLKNNLSLGLAPSLQALAKAFPRSQIKQSAKEDFRRFQDFLNEAELAFAAQEKSDFSEAIEHFRVTCRKYELAKIFALRFHEPFAIEKMDGKFSSFLKRHNPQDRIREGFDSLRKGNQNPTHFVSENLDPLLIQGEAQFFYERLCKNEQDHSSTGSIHVVDWGVQSAQSVSTFLDHIVFLDLEKNQSFYSRIYFHLCVGDEQALEDLKNNQALLKHKNIWFHQTSSPKGLPNWSESIYYLRIHQHLSERTSSALFYLDAKCKLYELQGALSLRQDCIIRSKDYGAGNKKRFFQEWRKKANPNLTAFHPETLNGILLRYQAKLLPKKEKEMKRYGEKVFAHTQGDLVYPLHAQALLVLKSLVQKLHPKGFAQIFDYGTAHFHPILHQQHYYASQFNRALPGVGFGNDLCFPILGLWAKEKGLKTSIFLQDKLLEKIVGKKMLDVTPLVPRYSRRKLIRHVSIEEGIFGLRYLRHYEKIILLSQESGEVDFYRFVQNLQERGYLGRGLAFAYHASAKNHLENLALELDFWINGIYTSLVGKENFRWIPMEHEMIRQALDSMKFDSARIFSEVQKNPHYGAAWVFRLER